MFEQIEFAHDSAEYKAFTEKFKPKKTTDDCYTPPEVYDAILAWVCEHYGIDAETVVRPFYPGGDYQHEDYAGKVVVDNPPFSILSQIERFYCDNGVPFFLFAPALTCLPRDTRVTVLACSTPIEYENGAVVSTCFVTNMSPGLALWTCPELYYIVKRVTEALKKKKSKALPKYEYPDAVLTAARAEYFAHHGVDFKVDVRDCLRISGLDEQKKHKKAAFGGALLLSERAAAERAAAERAAAIKWELSPAELMMQKHLG